MGMHQLSKKPDRGCICQRSERTATNSSNGETDHIWKCLECFDDWMIYWVFTLSLYYSTTHQSVQDVVSSFGQCREPFTPSHENEKVVLLFPEKNFLQHRGVAFFAKERLIFWKYKKTDFRQSMELVRFLEVGSAQRDLSRWPRLCWSTGWASLTLNC